MWLPALELGVEQHTALQNTGVGIAEMFQAVLEQVGTLAGGAHQQQLLIQGVTFQWTVHLVELDVGHVLEGGLDGHIQHGVILCLSRGILGGVKDSSFPDSLFSRAFTATAKG